MAQMNDFIISFIFLLVGVVFVSVLATEITGVTQANSILENISIANNTVTSLSHNQLDNFNSLVNATNTSDVFVLNTDYTVDGSAGTVTSLGPTGLARASYVYREVGDSTARSLTNLTIIFYVLGIFGAAVFFAIRGLKEAGVI